MSGTATSPSVDAMQALGQHLAAALIAAAGSKLSGAQLVFLPGGVSVPDDIVQSGGVNPTQLQTWLAMSFDYPFVASAGETSVDGRDESHGTATQLYRLAATQAQPIGDPQSDAWKRVAAQIAAARASLGPPGGMLMLACEPDDWPLSGAAQYWTKFDFSETQTVSMQPKTPLPIVNPRLWMVRSLDDRSIAVSRVLPAVPHEAGPRPVLTLAERPLAATVAPEAVPVHLVAWRSAAVMNQLPQTLNTAALLAAAPAVKTASATSSTAITVHLEYQIVTLGRFAAGQPWWDGTFLADNSWYVPGMARGGVLPAAGGGSYALPVALVVVRNFRISGQWSREAAALLTSQGGTVGPLSLFGAAMTTASDGVTVTFAHDGMQVVALLCSPLPVLPPTDSTATGSGGGMTGHP